MSRVLCREEQERVAGALLEGMSFRAIQRLTGVHRNTQISLIRRLGEACGELLDVTMRDLPCQRVEVDEVWTFVHKKKKRMTPADDPRHNGDQWVWIAMDPDTKLSPAHLVGARTLETGIRFMEDLEPRLAGRVQLSTDGLAAYVEAVEHAFGDNVDHGMLVKEYEVKPLLPHESPDAPRRRGRYTSSRKTTVQGNPDMESLSTSGIERLNLTLRMHLRRMSRRTNAHSKTMEMLRAHLNVFFVFYNFSRAHMSLGTTPAVAAGIIDRRWSLRDVVALSG